jgi:3-oxoadipate enol-lactonase
MGVYIAQKISILHPERVNKLVLCSTGAKLAAIGRLSFMTTREMLEANVPYELIIKNSLVRLYSNNFLSDPERVNNLIKLALAKPVEEARKTYFYQTEALFQHDTRDQLDKITQECLVIAGENDRTILAKSSRYLAEHIVNSKFIAVPNMGHMLPIEKPEVFCELVEAFLTK